MLGTVLHANLSHMTVHTLKRLKYVVLGHQNFDFRSNIASFFNQETNCFYPFCLYSYSMCSLNMEKCWPKGTLFLLVLLGKLFNIMTEIYLLAKSYQYCFPKLFTSIRDD